LIIWSVIGKKSVTPGIITIVKHFYILFVMQIVVAAETGGALGGMVRQLSIDQFENEGRRVIYGTSENATAARKLLDRQMSINSVPKKVCYCA
jgi:hypothetical protein